MCQPKRCLDNGVQFNAPRIGSLADYFTEKLPGVVPIADFEMLLHPDLAERLEKYGEVGLIDMRIDTSYPATASAVDESLYPAIERLNNAGVGSIEIVLKGAQLARRPLTARLWDAVKRIALTPQLREGVDRLNVRAMDNEGHKVELLDLLEDRLVETVEVSRAQLRDPDTLAAMMYQHIGHAYEKHADEIQKAMRVG